MRVTRVRTTIVSVPFVEVERWALGDGTTATEVIVQVDTDEGITGLGESIAPVCPEAVAAAVRGMAAAIVGHDPFEIEAFYGRLFSGRWQYYRRFGHAAAAGIEIALWDIVGKALGQPVHRLLGGAVRDRIDHFFWVQRKEPQLMAEEARRGREQGFSVFYTYAGLDRRGDVEAAEALREGAGPDARIRVDGSSSWTAAEAVQVIRAMSHCGLDFVEQPIPMTDIDGLVHIRRTTGVPVCVDQSAWTQWDIYEVLRRQAADFLCSEPARCGGLLQFKKTCAIAEVANVPICRHVAPELGIMSAAALQVCATVRNLTLGNQSWARLLSDDIIVEDLRTFTEGTLRVPTGPGLGVTLDEAKLDRYAELYRTSSQAS